MWIIGLQWKGVYSEGRDTPLTYSFLEFCHVAIHKCVCMGKTCSTVSEPEGVHPTPTPTLWGYPMQPHPLPHSIISPPCTKSCMIPWRMLIEPQLAKYMYVHVVHAWCTCTYVCQSHVLGIFIVTVCNNCSSPWTHFLQYISCASFFLKDYTEVSHLMHTTHLYLITSYYTCTCRFLRHCCRVHHIPS